MASGHVNRTNRPNTWLHRPASRDWWTDGPLRPQRARRRFRGTRDRASR